MTVIAPPVAAAAASASSTPGDRVVVGQREQLDAGVERPRDDLRRRERAVGGRRVGLQIKGRRGAHAGAYGLYGPAMRLAVRLTVVAIAVAACALVPAAAPAAVPGHALGQRSLGLRPVPRPGRQRVRRRTTTWTAPGHIGASADGRYVVFASRSDGLSAEDDDRYTNIFVRDRTTATTTLVSRASGAGGAAANGNSDDPTISDDGRFVAFSSEAGNLAAQDTNSFRDIYVRDLQTGDTILISAVGGGTPVTADGSSTEPAISGDGSTVAFASTATNLDGLLNPDASADPDIYRRTVSGTQPALISRAGGALGAKGNGSSFEAAISDDGTVIAFGPHRRTSTRPTRRDRRRLPARCRAGHADDGSSRGRRAPRAPPPNSYAEAPAIDGDGDAIAFVSARDEPQPRRPLVRGRRLLRRVTAARRRSSPGPTGRPAPC